MCVNIHTFTTANCKLVSYENILVIKKNTIFFISVRSTFLRFAKLELQFTQFQTIYIIKIYK